MSNCFHYIILNPKVKYKKVESEKSVRYNRDNRKPDGIQGRKEGFMADREKRERLKRQIEAAAGAQAELVLKNARVVNVFTDETEEADIAIEDGYIVGIGRYTGRTQIDLSGRYVCPGFIDGHIHLESSMISPVEFARAVVPHGTTAVVADPHEIANVAGLDGLEYMLNQTGGLPLDVYFVLPSCVPATGLDESGAVLGSDDLKPYYGRDRILGLAEVMNAYGTIRGEEGILDKILDAKENGGVVDGHAPGLAGSGLNAYITAGVRSDHECSTASEAIEKLRRGQWIMIREGTAAKNLYALLPLFEPGYCRHCMLVTDDKHPEDLIHKGHIDYIIREAIRLGADPFCAIRMGSLHAAQYFGLDDMGAAAPGYRANLAVVSDLKNFEVHMVLKDGRIVARDGRMEESGLRLRPDGWEDERICHTFHMKEAKPEDIRVRENGKFQRVIGLTPGELLTRELIVPWSVTEGTAPGVNMERGIIKAAVFERHRATGHVGIGYLYGYGLRKGAVASSIGHDSHNLIAAGTTDEDIVLAANTVRKNQGGLAVCAEGKVLGELALPIAGLMCGESAEAVEARLNELKRRARELGVPEGIDPFMTLAFISLPVIPELRLTTLGLIDTASMQVVRTVFQ